MIEHDRELYRSTEPIEWCDFWIEDTGNRYKPRILLIGDSISRDYRPHVIDIYQGRVLTDNIASSRALDNPDYRRELAHILEDGRLRYDVIHLNNGLHGWHLSGRAYGRYLEETVDYISSVSEARLILALSTPVYDGGRGYENERNKAVAARNQIVQSLAEKKGLAVDDLYSVVFGRDTIRMEDGVHYRSEGSRLLAGRVVESIGL